jgi:1,4-dihydroxy-2-naphthoate octaprenyltransferase
MIKTSWFRVLEHLRPVYLAISLALYLLGTGFTRYLGERLDLPVFILGLGWLIFMQLGFFTLGDHIQSPFDMDLFSSRSEKNKPWQESAPEAFSHLLLSSVSLLAGAAALTLILGIRGSVNTASALVMGSYFLLSSLMIIPGLSLDLSGVGEIISSTILVVLPPALAFVLQMGTFHRFLPLGVSPLFPLNLALIFIMRLKRYPSDLASSRKTLLVRLGWVQGIFIHNLLVLSGFFLFGISLLFGMPFGIIGPVFLVIPAGIFLIWYLSRLENGAPVRWPLITTLSLVVFFLPIYLMTFTVWIR